jgi:hypothetical protein
MRTYARSASRCRSSLKESTSNFDFHYMGSARIMAPIGKDFAESMVEMMRGQQRESTR